MLESNVSSSASVFQGSIQHHYVLLVHKNQVPDLACSRRLNSSKVSFRMRRENGGDTRMWAQLLG